MGIKKKVHAVQLSKVDKPTIKPTSAKPSRQPRFKRYTKNAMKALALVITVVAAAYGFRTALESLPQWLALGITGIIMACLVYIIVE